MDRNNRRNRLHGIQYQVASSMYFSWDSGESLKFRNLIYTLESRLRIISTPGGLTSFSSPLPPPLSLAMTKERYGSLVVHTAADLSHADVVIRLRGVVDDLPCLHR